MDVAGYITGHWCQPPKKKNRSHLTLLPVQISPKRSLSAAVTERGCGGDCIASHAPLSLSARATETEMLSPHQREEEGEEEVLVEVEEEEEDDDVAAY